MNASRSILLGLALSALGGVAGAQAPSALLPTPSAARFWWSDYDGDGDVDAFVLHPTDGVALLCGYGDGSFENVTVRVGLGGLEGVTQALWRDVDGDARPELYVVAPSATSRLFRFERETFVDVTSAAGLALGTPVRHGEWVDVDGDGRDDLHLSTARGELVLRNTGALRFEELELGVAPVAVAWSRELVAWTEEGRPLAVPEVDKEVPAATSGAPSVGSSSVPGRTVAAATPFCWDLLKDQSTGNCLTASSVPTVGSLFPLSQQFNIDFAGRVGVGTLSPGAALDVIGSIRADQQLISTAASGPPLAVSSSDLVTNLNADLLDGMDGAALAVLGDSISTAELEDGAVTTPKLALGAVGSLEVMDGSIVDADVAASAAIAGTKIDPDFGAQDLFSTGVTTLGDAFLLQQYYLKVEGLFPPTRGYLGVQGHDDFDAIVDLDIGGLEVGVLGVSEGTTTNDNYGVLGQATFAGVRGQHSGNPTSNFGELGRGGFGVWGEGTVSGGHFESGNVAGEFESGFDGVWASTSFGGGYGIWGAANSSSGLSRGVYGKSSSTAGRGVFGWASAPSGTTYGVYGQASSSSGRGVYGHATNSSGANYGVLGRAAGSNGRGVRGEGLATSGTNYGVQGRTFSPSGYGVISYGSSGSTGQKNFIQPHPTDPSREIHFTSLEGNESGTYFRGSSVLAGGRVEIDVPEAYRLVSEPEGLTVQLTPRGPGADLWVVSVDLERVVVSGAWDVEFDYQVNGVRRGFAEHRTFRENHAYVPEERGVPFATELPEDVRRILVENGILNPDYTPNEALAASMGWELRDPNEEAALEAEHQAARAAHEAAHPATQPTSAVPQDG